MSGLKPITVNTAPEAEPHIYAEDDAAIYQSIFGSDGVMTIGQQCASQVISNNKVRVKDGVIVVGGHVARIPYGEYIDCEIANGQSGVNRNDIITAKFVTTGSGGIDTYTCEVKQGVAGSSASDPALTQNDIYAGGKIREMPLYRVKIEGLSIVAVEQMFDLIPTIPDLEEQIADLNSNSIIESGSNANGYYRKYADGTLEMWGKKTAQYYCRTAAGNGYVSSEIPVTFPLDSLTACNIEVQQVVGSISGVFAGASAASALTGFNVYVTALFQIQEARTGYFHWRATGTWK